MSVGAGKRLFSTLSTDSECESPLGKKQHSHSATFSPAIMAGATIASSSSDSQALEGKAEMDLTPDMAAFKGSPDWAFVLYTNGAKNFQ
jgi:hypothetical protein